MKSNDFFTDKYEHYEDQFNPLITDRKARRKRKAKVKHTPKKSNSQIITEVADTMGLEGGFKTTYQPARHEEVWLLDSLETFIEQEFITDVLTKIKGGKEANVYYCQAHPITDVDWLAAKVYRPRMFRNLRNDKMYRQGRETLTPNGHAIKRNEYRIMRALDKKTKFGAQVQHTSWLMHEYKTLERLYQAGAAVPRPVAAGDNAILMSYHGDEGMAAPTLNGISLKADEATHLFQEVLRNIKLMLQHGLIHGDLSAYNILYWERNITIIDFPQVVARENNDQAYFILHRDVQRVCQYFTQQGVDCDPEFIMYELW